MEWMDRTDDGMGFDLLTRPRPQHPQQAKHLFPDLPLALGIHQSAPLAPSPLAPPLIITTLVTILLISNQPRPPGKRLPRNEECAVAPPDAGARVEREPVVVAGCDRRRGDRNPRQHVQGAEVGWWRLVRDGLAVVGDGFPLALTSGLGGAVEGAVVVVVVVVEAADARAGT